MLPLHRRPWVTGRGSSTTGSAPAAPQVVLLDSLGRRPRKICMRLGIGVPKAAVSSLSYGMKFVRPWDTAESLRRETRAGQLSPAAGTGCGQMLWLLWAVLQMSLPCQAHSLTLALGTVDLAPWPSSWVSWLWQESGGSSSKCLPGQKEAGTQGRSQQSRAAAAGAGWLPANS